MLVNLRKLIITALFLCLANNTHAIPSGFIDNGTFTVNTSQGLEWLDLTETVNRSFLDIQTEINSGSGLGADGWRFASDQELQVMLSDFFGISYTGGPFVSNPFGPGQNLIVNEFISLFGDTFQSFLDISGGDINDNSVGITANATTSGYTSGIHLVSGHATGRFIFDFEITKTLGVVEDRNDTINGYGIDVNTPYSDLGSWLVRTATVPEPVTLALFIAGLGLLGIQRKFRGQYTYSKYHRPLKGVDVYGR